MVALTFCPFTLNLINTSVCGAGVHGFKSHISFLQINVRAFHSFIIQLLILLLSIDHHQRLKQRQLLAIQNEANVNIAYQASAKLP